MSIKKIRQWAFFATVMALASLRPIGNIFDTKIFHPLTKTTQLFPTTVPFLWVRDYRNDVVWRVETDRETRDFSYRSGWMSNWKGPYRIGGTLAVVLIWPDADPMAPDDRNFRVYRQLAVAELFCKKSRLIFAVDIPGRVLRATRFSLNDSGEIQFTENYDCPI